MSKNAVYKIMDIFNKVLDKHSPDYIATKINVAIGTVKRWHSMNSVPELYIFELMKLADMEIDYSKFTFKQKDQFFTPVNTAKKCYATFMYILNKYGDNHTDYTYIEPSAGSGNFLKQFPIKRRIGLDIEPRDKEIKKADYLNWKPPPSENTKYIVFGNPPFGLRGQLALKFINHSADFADYVCFILPQLFESDGKGVPRKRVKVLNLIHSEKINTSFQSPDGKLIDVKCIFQVWSKYRTNEMYNIREIDDKVIKIYSLSDGNTPSTTRNKKMFNKCDIYIPSTCFGKSKMTYYDNFEDLPGRKGYGIVFNKNKKKNIERFRKIDWSKVAFLSTNSAYNIRTSQIKSQFI
jgi:hypothetical protein